MPGKVIQLESLKGLHADQIPSLRQQFGKNIFKAEPSRHFLHIAWDIAKEPMFILLTIACSLYFVLGSIDEGIMMLVAMMFVTAISLYQETKSSRALNALKQLTEPKIKVVRDGVEIVLPTEELVPGDIIMLEEGMKVPADAFILQGNDLSINESIISGESVPVEKQESIGNNNLYQGTTVNSGKCIPQVTATGNNTVLGKLGKAVGAYQPPKTLLQLQINRFVRLLAIFGLTGLLLIFFLNFLNGRDWATSLLFALTLALSAVPEEIPVAFSSFMALGAHKMSRLGIISRQPQIVENLGAVTVICLDKTGTITENKMQVNSIYDYDNDRIIDLGMDKPLENQDLLFYGVLASESDPFDAMEKGIWQAYFEYTGGNSHTGLKMIYEYPLEGRPPMMTHVYEKGGLKIVAAKGAAERILKICKLGDTETEKVTAHIKTLASKGYRVIGVASSYHGNSPFPESQEDFKWQFEGLLALYDPPKENIAEVLREFYRASIDVKLLTGDFSETAINIAGKAGIPNQLKCIEGHQVMAMSKDELKDVVKTTNVFARMFPEAKTKVIEALKDNGEIVAMTGDGVNDGPALKSASIGIAMGKKGTEIARQASDLILTDDNLEKMVTGISEGRKIFTNLKKAVLYIISIHIPIVLLASLPLIFGWLYPNIFTPIHVIFMELIMGPTCSIFFEREPVEENNMLKKPRGRDYKLFTREELFISITQGTMIAVATLSLYYYFMKTGASLEETRTVVFTTLLLSNVFLTFADRSFTQTIMQTSRYKNNLVPVVLIISGVFIVSLHLFPPIRQLFQLTSISLVKFLLCFAVAFVSVMWFEAYKMYFPRNGKTTVDKQQR